MGTERCKKANDVVSFFWPSLVHMYDTTFLERKEKKSKNCFGGSIFWRRLPPPKQEGKGSLVKTKLVCNFLGNCFSTLCMYGIIKRTFKDALSGTENTE